MLESSLFESRDRKKTRKPQTVAVSIFLHVLTGAVLVLIPLLQTQALTIPAVDASLFLPRMEPPPDSVPVFSAQPPAQTPPQTADPIAFTAPTNIPAQIKYVVEAPPSGPVSLPFSSGTGPGSALGNLGNTPIAFAAPAMQPPSPPPPPPPPMPITNTQPVRRGGTVQAANLIHQVKPDYPPIARLTRTQGVVVLEAVISKDGSIDRLRVVSGPPVLIQAALDAVKQWKYRPTMLNSEPVEVITTVTVTFTLQ
jgi:protein TonB